MIVISVSRVRKGRPLRNARMIVIFVELASFMVPWNTPSDSTHWIETAFPCQLFLLILGCGLSLYDTDFFVYAKLSQTTKIRLGCSAFFLFSFFSCVGTDEPPEQIVVGSALELIHKITFEEMLYHCIVDQINKKKHTMLLIYIYVNM